MQINRSMPVFKNFVKIESNTQFRQYNHSFNGRFPGQPGQASTRMSQLWILLEIRIIEVVQHTARGPESGPPSVSIWPTKPTDTVQHEKYSELVAD